MLLMCSVNSCRTVRRTGMHLNLKAPRPTLNCGRFCFLSSPTAVTVRCLGWLLSEWNYPWYQCHLLQFLAQILSEQHLQFACPIHWPKYHKTYIHVPTSTDNDVWLVDFILNWKQPVVMASLMPGGTFKLLRNLFCFLIVNPHSIVLSSSCEIFSFRIIIHCQNVVFLLYCLPYFFPGFSCKLIQISICASDQNYWTHRWCLILGSPS